MIYDCIYYFAILDSYYFTILDCYTERNKNLRWSVLQITVNYSPNFLHKIYKRLDFFASAEFLGQSTQPTSSSFQLLSAISQQVFQVTSHLH